MIDEFLSYMKGYVRVRVEGDSVERFLNLCAYHELSSWELRKDMDAVLLTMSIHDFRKIRPLARKTKIKIRIVKKCGLPYFTYRHRKRTLFFIGLILCIGLLKVNSLFIWNIHFSGNSQYTDEMMLDFLKKKGVSVCMLRKKVDCPQIAKELRNQYDKIVWASVSVRGSVLKIDLKENEDMICESVTEEGKSVKPTDLVASCDGVVTKMVTRRGTPMVHEGDEVKKGDVLVTGRIEVLDDNKEVINYQYCQADADIYADTELPFQEKIGRYYDERHYTKKKNYQLIFRGKKKQYKLGIPCKDQPMSETYYHECFQQLGEHLELPVSFGIMEVKFFDKTRKKYSPDEIRMLLSEDFERFSKDLREKGIQIRGNSVKIHLYEKSAIADGMIFVNEKITQKADTEIITIERKKADESVGTDDGNTG